MLTLVPKEGIESKPMTQRPLKDPNFAVTLSLGTLDLGIPSRFDFDNPPCPQYNPLYIKSAHLALGSLPGAV